MLRLFLQYDKKRGDDKEAIKKALDKTEYFLTSDIDFKACMDYNEDVI